MAALCWPTRSRTRRRSAPMPFSHERDIAHFDRWAPRLRPELDPVGLLPTALPQSARAGGEAWRRTPGQILDVGCGTGGFLRLAAQADFPAAELAGVDPSVRMLANRPSAVESRDRQRLTIRPRPRGGAPVRRRGPSTWRSPPCRFTTGPIRPRASARSRRVLRPGAALPLGRPFRHQRPHRLFYAGAKSSGSASTPRRRSTSMLAARGVRGMPMAGSSTG